MQIRLMGTPTELTRAAAVLAQVLTVHRVSDIYPNRGATEQGRLYLDAALPPEPKEVR
ncbi:MULTISPECIES: hypothetical protein [Thermocrispum]|uniref:Uncharacterized protein n=1 Tax=Thermocrispum agreste TaxID=37925 RepID=A0ABD6FJ14_9PSEU|nr:MULTISPECIES: hypothetical protein [Thermocrispum]